MDLFIDTNIYLSFYDFSNRDLHELETLSHLVSNKELKLYITQQVKDEYLRNRESKIYQTFKDIQDQKFGFKPPRYCLESPHYKELCENLNEANKHHDSLISEMKDLISNKGLKADILIKNLFENSIEIKITDEIYNLAIKREAIGNPPRKTKNNKGIGDALNWECLLQYNDIQTLNLISVDSDYSSSFDKNHFNEFLKQEWDSEKVWQSKSVSFYRDLVNFFNSEEKFKTINLTDEKSKDDLISSFSKSENFSQTHQFISKLTKYSNFTKKQRYDLLDALISNGQIYAIANDPDITDFYLNYLDFRDIDISEDDLDSLRSIFNIPSDRFIEVFEIPF